MAVLAWTPEAVISMWQMHKSPFYAVFEGTKDNIIYAQDSDDENEAETKLRETLKYILDGGSTAVFTLRIYNDGEKISNKKEYKGSIPFKLNQFDSFSGSPRRGRAEDNDRSPIVVMGTNGQPAATPPVPTHVSDKLDKLIEQNHLLLQHFILKSEEVNYDDEDTEEDDDASTQISEQEKILQQAERWANLGSQVMNIPAVNGLVSTLLQRLIPAPAVNGQQSNSYQQPQQIGSMNTEQVPQVTDEQVKQGLTNIVTLIGDDKWRHALVLLGNMAIQNPNQLTWLLSMLK